MPSPKTTRHTGAELEAMAERAFQDMARIESALPAEARIFLAAKRCSAIYGRTFTADAAKVDAYLARKEQRDAQP